MQHELEVSTKQAIFVDSSINDTIRTCIVLGNHRAALKVKTEFKVCKLLFSVPSSCSKQEVLSLLRSLVNSFAYLPICLITSNCGFHVTPQVSEKRWYWLKVFALATTRDWVALETFSKEKRPAIGKLPIISVKYFFPLTRCIYTSSLFA